MSKSPFEFHTGQTARLISPKQMVMDCPFCDKVEHFYFNPEENVWDCKVCLAKGNAYTFITMLHDIICKNETDDLQSKKGLPRRHVENNKVRYNPLNGTYVIPTFNNKGSMNNLYKYVVGNNTIYATPSLEASLFNWDETTEDTIWLCEGHWDKIAAEAIIGSGKPITAIGVPGAGTFKPSWCGAIANKDVVLIYDNDKSGELGIENVLKKLKDAPQKPRSIQRVVWPDSSPEGYDLRDHYVQYGRAAYRELQSLIKPIENAAEVVKVTKEVIEADLSCDSYDKALDVFQTAYLTTDDMKKALAVVLASIWSVKFDGQEQLWLKIIGPPGGGKTRIAKAVSASEQVVSKSTFTGLFSGWRDANADVDNSLIPLISGRTLFVKDADALLKQPDVQRIFSELRDYYDKESSPFYRHGANRDYRNSKSTVVICGTQALRSADHSFLGERFLGIELDITKDEERLINQKVMDRCIAVATKQQSDPETKIMACMKGFINHLMERENESTIPKPFQDLIMDQCCITALMRASVERNFSGDIMSPPMPELPTRLIGQIVVATFALCVVLGKSQADNDVFMIINKLMKDTINPRSYRYKICMYLLERPNATAGEIKHECQISNRRFEREIDDMVALGLMAIGKQPSTGLPGAAAFKFILSDEVRSGLGELR